MVDTARQRLPRAQLGEAAARVLQGNDRGTMTVAAPRLYPHQWSWDAAFVAIGLTHLSIPRACLELDTLLPAGRPPRASASRPYTPSRSPGSSTWPGGVAVPTGRSQSRSSGEVGRPCTPGTGG